MFVPRYISTRKCIPSRVPIVNYYETRSSSAAYSRLTERERRERKRERERERMREKNENRKINNYKLTSRKPPTAGLHPRGESL